MCIRDSHWALFGLGQLSFYLILSLTSMGSNAPVGSSRWLSGLCAAGMATPFLILRSDAIMANPAWIAVGFFASVIGDTAMRFVAMARRSEYFLHPGMGYKSVPAPGGASWRLFFLGPLVPLRPRIFISYSERSPWSSQTASVLYLSL